MLKNLKFLVILLFSHPMANDQALDKFDKTILSNPEHSLIQASSKYTSNNPMATCADYNNHMAEIGITPHPGSRANNVLTRSQITQFQRCGKVYFMQTRPINFLNLFQLKTGPHTGQYMGANQFTLKDASYIATEAPFNRDDYYRMILDTNAKILVSLTTATDDLPETNTFFPLRGGLSVALHHLKAGESISFENNQVSFLSEFEKDGITTKVLQVTPNNNTPYTIHHIIVKKWMDGTLASSATDLRLLLKRIERSEQELQTNSANPLTVNCGYGYGRTGILILMHQLMRKLNTGELELSNLDIQPLLSAIELNVAYGSPTGPDSRESEKKRLKNIASEVFSEWGNS